MKRTSLVVEFMLGAIVARAPGCGDAQVATAAPPPRAWCHGYHVTGRLNRVEGTGGGQAADYIVDVCVGAAPW